MARSNRVIAIGFSIYVTEVQQNPGGTQLNALLATVYGVGANL